MTTLQSDLNQIHSDDLIPIGTLRGVTISRINREQAEQREAQYRAENIAIGKRVNEGE